MYLANGDGGVDFGGLGPHTVQGFVSLEAHVLLLTSIKDWHRKHLVVEGASMRCLLRG